VQGRPTVLSPAARALPLYQLQLVVHGSTAPICSRQVSWPACAAPSRAPARARRLLFVWGVGAPPAARRKTRQATSGESALYVRRA
jgi:hypothetical protein